jgi:hypothetical protein
MKLGFWSRHRHAAVAALLMLGGLLGAAGEAAQATSDITPQAIPVCYHFGCNTKEVVGINDEEWRQVADWFARPAESAGEERVRIKKAVGWLEVIVGRYTPIHLDLGQDELTETGLGQMDCIDEEKNVTAFLQLFQNQGLLKFHRVVEPAYRRTAWDQHWAGQIEELRSGRRWVVDSWFQPYGFNPYIQEYEQWADIPFFFSSSYIDNSPD